MKLRRPLLPVLTLALAASPPSAAQGDLELELVEVTDGLTRPISIAHAGDGSDRLFIVQQTGEIVILSGGELLPTPFLDISALVTCCGERGLLGLAFHPDHASNGYFYVHYSGSTGGHTVVERYEVSSADTNIADPGSDMTVLTHDQPNTNHNGGQLAFGPDGYLYIALGDGGGSGDPGDNGQDLTTWLGKILRIDVDGDDFPLDEDLNYAVPSNNPFVGEAALDEIWAWGLRNPWRLSFDRLTGDLWIGDVGQSDWEEVDFQPASSEGGENYGWDVLEGGLQSGTPGPGHPNCYTADPKRDDDCDDFLTGSSTLPVLEYANGSNCAVTGGFRSRGSADPRLSGVYFYADYCSGIIWGALPNCNGGFTTRMLHAAADNISAFGEGEGGELYVTQYRFTAGQSSLHRITADPTSGGPELVPDQTALDFGALSVGGNTTLELTLDNGGTGVDNLVVEDFLLTDDVHFSLDVNAGGSPCGAAPLCLASGDDCTLQVTFEPQREGGFAELLLLSANSVPAPVTLLGTVPCTGAHGPALSNNTISTSEVYTDCDAVTAGPNLTVAASGDLEIRAGGSIAIAAPMSVASGAALSLVLDPALTDD